MKVGEVLARCDFFFLASEMVLWFSGVGLGLRFLFGGNGITWLELEGRMVIFSLLDPMDHDRDNELGSVNWQGCGTGVQDGLHYFVQERRGQYDTLSSCIPALHIRMPLRFSKSISSLTLGWLRASSICHVLVGCDAITFVPGT